MVNVGPGWHPDPSGTGGLRWWDGHQWTEHFHHGPQMQQTPQPVNPPRFTQPERFDNRTLAAGLFRTNSMSLISIFVILIYAFLAAQVGVIYLGILPVTLTIRAFSRKERLAPIALLVTIGGLVFVYSQFTK